MTTITNCSLSSNNSKTPYPRPHPPICFIMNCRRAFLSRTTAQVVFSLFLRRLVFCTSKNKRGSEWLSEQQWIIIKLMLSSSVLDYPVTSCRSAVIREQNVSTLTSRWLHVLFVWICYQFGLVLQLPMAHSLSPMLIKPNMPQMRKYLSTKLNKFARSGQTSNGRAERKIEDFYRAQHSTTNFYYLRNARSPFASVPISYYHLWLYRSRRQSTNRIVGKHRRPARYFIEFLSAAESGAVAFQQMNLRSFNEAKMCLLSNC